MLKFEKVEDNLAKRIINTRGKRANEYYDLCYDFLDSNIEVAKLTGYTSTEAISVYQALVSVANGSMKQTGLKISKRGETIYLLNTKVNPVASAPEKR